MKNKASEAGYEVVEGSDVTKLIEAWQSGDYKHIVYYNHGYPRGNLGFDYRRKPGDENPQRANPPLYMFNLLNGYADEVDICCCQSKTVVSQEVIVTFAEGKVDFGRATPPYEGELNREDAYILLGKAFDEIIRHSGKDACVK